MSERIARLQAAGIQVIASETTSHYFLERDGFMAFAERREGELGNIGSPGLITERGFAVLIWRGDQPFFVGKGFELAASDEQVQKLRAFAADLDQAAK